MFRFEIETTRPDETEMRGEQLARCLPRGTVLALEGDLGAGKTTWTRGLLRGLGLPTNDYSSPTFTLCQSYGSPELGQLHHFDVYRLEGAEAFCEAGLEEVLNDDQAWVIVEWAHRIQAVLPADHWTLRLERLAPSSEGGGQPEAMDWLHLNPGQPLILDDQQLPERRRLTLSVPGPLSTQQLDTLKQTLWDWQMQGGSI